MDGLYMRTLGKWHERVTSGLDALARVSCQDLAEETIDGTPVDTGFLVGNWQPSLDVPVVKVTDENGPAAANAKLGLVIAKLQPGNIFYYVNNAVYAKRIEWGFQGEDSLGRLYDQDGRFMVTKAIQRWPKIVNAAAAKLGLDQ